MSKTCFDFICRSQSELDNPVRFEWVINWLFCYKFNLAGFIFFFFLGVDRLAGRARPNTINIKIKVDYQSDMQGHNHWCSTIYRFHFLKVIENVQMKNKEKILILICTEPCHKPCCHSTMSTLQLGLN